MKNIIVYADNRIKNFLRGDMKYIYIIGEHNGLRVSDVIELKVKHLKIKKPTIREKKTGKSKRIYIPEKTRRILRERAEKRKDSETDYIFQSPRNKKKHISRQAVWKAFGEAENMAAKNGIRINVGTHSMRKAYAQKLLSKGKSYDDIRKKLNHAQYADTLRYLIQPQTGQTGGK